MSHAFENLERAPFVEWLTRHPSRSLIGARLGLAPEEGEGYWEFTRIGDDLFVIVENFSYKDPRLELVPGDGLIQFNFRLSGDITFAVSKTEPLRMAHPALLIWNQEQGFDMSEWTAPSARERAIVLSMRPDFLKAHFLTSVVDVPPQLQPFVAHDRGPLNYCQLSLSAQMFETANRFLNSSFTGPLALVYTEAIALELLCCAVQSFVGISSPPNEQYSERELRCLHAARAYLMQHLAPAPTIRDVSRAAGMNETSLKRGFKSTFGETPFDFSVRCRMQRALAMLRDERASVSRVAEAAGYRHQTSFATAFFRHFGMRPKDVRGRRTRRS